MASTVSHVIWRQEWRKPWMKRIFDYALRPSDSGMKNRLSRLGALESFSQRAELWSSFPLSARGRSGLTFGLATAAGSGGRARDALSCESAGRLWRPFCRIRERPGRSLREATSSCGAARGSILHTRRRGPDTTCGNCRCVCGDCTMPQVLAANDFASPSPMSAAVAYLSVLETGNSSWAFLSFPAADRKERRIVLGEGQVLSRWEVSPERVYVVNSIFAKSFVGTSETGPGLRRVFAWSRPGVAYQQPRAHPGCSSATGCARFNFRPALHSSHFSVLANGGLREPTV